MIKKKRIFVTVDEDVHNQITSYFEEQGEKFNLSEAVQDVERGLLHGLRKHKETMNLVAPLLRAKTMAGLMIGEAFQSLFSDVEKAEAEKKKTTKTD